ncbi:MAG: CRTAC1 family protein [Zavarzinella sp.]|nr:CRTAC1 family protein [Zavarzinella sp.]
MAELIAPSRTRKWPRVLAVLALLAGIVVLVAVWWNSSTPTDSRAEADGPTLVNLDYKPRDPDFDTSGYTTVVARWKPWPATATLEEVAAVFAATPDQIKKHVDERLADPLLPDEERLFWTVIRARLLNYQGKPAQAYQVLAEARTLAEGDPRIAEQALYTIIYFQGVTALRQGETENCILCRGESSCILPIVPAAVHTNPTGSRLAIRHFSEYLDRFPDDLGVRWLLNVAYMTLGEHPQNVQPNRLLTLAPYLKSEFDIGRFRDVGHLVGVNRFNFQGGGIMDDFDNDDRLDIVVTSNNLTQPMAFYRNKGDGTFEERTKEAGLDGQLGGLYCVQADFNNDGHMDVFVPRGAWTPFPVRPSLLRNNGDGSFTDVTNEAGLDAPLNSLSACWADFDNDGFLDLFVPCGPQRCRLYRNKGDGTFEDVAEKAGLTGEKAGPGIWRSATWIDYDKDGYPDLFVNTINGTAALYHNNRNGTFTDVTREMGIDGPPNGFSCWAFDYDNDGWPDIFATCYNYTLADAVRGLEGQPHANQTNRLYKNLGGKGFKDVTKEAGLDMVFATMGSNFADFDNDGYLDMYLATGGPDLALLVPNRMFKNVGGKRFAEITASSGTGNLQKGHSVACGDWDRNGTLDLFVQMGGVTYGDQYHNILFQNPGQGNNWLNVKLVGKKTNRCAIGARIKVVTAGADPLTVYRHVTSGSSFGANPLEQLIGVGKADRIAMLEVSWPASGTTQTFRDLAVNQAIEITEFASDFRKREYKAIPLPK